MTQSRPRAGRVVPLLEAAWLDVRYAARLLTRRPLFSAAAILTLALAIGANITVFRLIDRVLLHPLDMPDVFELVVVQREYESPSGPGRSSSLTWAQAEALRQMSSLGPVAASSFSRDRATQRVVLAQAGRELTAAAGVSFVSANYFRVLGVTPAIGRNFEPGDDTPDAPPVAILGHRFWRARFGGDAGVLGRTLTINGSPVTVVGVAARTFTGTELTTTPPDLFLPLMSARRLATRTGSDVDSDGRIFMTGSRVGLPSSISPVGTVTVIARVTPGSERRAEAEINARVDGEPWSLVPLVDTMLAFESQADLRRFLGLLGTVVGLTLVIGCANLTGLLLARAEERRPELSVRAALGAGRGRLVQQVAIEACTLAAAGGAAALVVAFWIDRGLAAFVLPGGIAVSSLREGADARTLAFALLATAVAAIAVGVAPAALSANGRLALDVKGTRGGHLRLGGMRVVLGVQVAVCVVLVVSAGLFVRSLSNALATDVGFDPRGLISAAVSVPPGMAPAGSLEPLDALDALVERAKTLPGVAGATAGPLPLVRGGDLTRREVRVDGRPVTVSTSVDVVHAAPDYFTTLGQAVVQGRDFTTQDRAGTRPVAIVNEAAARLFWPAGDALEREIGSPPSSGSFAVVGIARDAKLRTLRDTDRPVIYLARQQHQFYLAGFAAGFGSSFLIVRASGDPAGVGRSIQRLAREAGVSAEVVTLEQGINALLMPQRLGRALLVLLGAMALALTVVGVHGLVSCVVARGTKEIGVRMALGAGVRDIVHTVARRALLPVIGGVVAGSLVAWLGGRLADRFMYGMSGSDPATIAVAIAVVVASGLLAALVPARRALGISPIEALRTD